MQLIRLIRKDVLMISFIFLAACSSKNKVETEPVDAAGSSGYPLQEQGNIGSVDEQVQQKIQSLQQDNVVYFALDKYDITSSYANMLDTHAEFLRDNPSYKVTIEGHTDERGTPEYNIALGERRASAVKLYLQGRGVSADQIEIVSYGKEKPVALGHDETAYSQNRRAVLIY